MWSKKTLCFRSAYNDEGTRRAALYIHEYIILSDAIINTMLYSGWLINCNKTDQRIYKRNYDSRKKKVKINKNQQIYNVKTAKSWTLTEINYYCKIPHIFR